MNTYKISEYIANLPLQKSFCRGYRSDDVYDVICNICSMYNQLLSEAYAENDELKRELEYLGMDRRLQKNHQISFEPKLETKKSHLFDKEENKEESRDCFMADKEIQKLKRGELLEVLLEQSKAMDDLKMQLQEKDDMIDSLNQKLTERKIDIQEAGTIAEASFKLNGVFEAAEKAAQQYLENLKELYDREQSVFSLKEEETENRCAALLKATQERCDFMKENAMKECEELETAVKARCQALEEEVESRCRQREEEAENKCAYLDAKAKEDVDKRWSELSEKLEEFYKAHQGIKELLAMTTME